MKHYQNILVAVSISLHAKALIARAQDIQQLSQARLQLAHVLDDHRMVYAGGEFALTLKTTLDSNAAHQIHNQLLQLAIACQLQPHECHLVHGEKANELVELVNKLRIDLLVVGAHHKQGFRCLLGSTAESLLHALPCDILMVKQ